jgi:phosphoribosylglycinamide formyltransferase-1
MKKRIAVLASGSGTTAEAFIRATQAGSISAEIGLIICNRKDAGIFERIEKLNRELGLTIESVLVNSKTHPISEQETEQVGRQTKAEEAAILKLLIEGGYEIVALMGYMKKSGTTIVHEYGWHPEYTSIYQARMLNTHPGLLPETAGLYGELVQRHVLAHHLPYGGQTLHVVAEKYDDGPIVAEHKVAVMPDDTPESLFSRVQAVEKQMLPLDIQHFIDQQEIYNQQTKETV